MKRDHLNGQQFGYWQVLSFSYKNERGELYWNCICRCGTKRDVKAASLRSGRSTSCGCYHREAVTDHGMTATKTFKSWDAMRQRCSNPNARGYASYGGRGIRVCDRWLNSFEWFLADMGERPPGKTLDRIDVNGDYTPTNCRWASASQQQRNKRDQNRLTCDGRTLSFADWAEICGIPAKVIAWRVRNGWPKSKALSEPIMPGRGKRKGT